MYTHYHNLRLTPLATHEEIIAAYHILINKEDPDYHPEKERWMHLKNIRIINASYRVLSTPKLRLRYDTWLIKKNGGKLDEGLYRENHFEKARNPFPVGKITVITLTVIIGLWVALKLTLFLIASSPAGKAVAFRLQASEELANLNIKLPPGIKLNRAYLDETEDYTLNFDYYVDRTSELYNHEFNERTLSLMLSNENGMPTICKEKTPVIWRFSYTFSDEYKDVVEIKAIELCKGL